MKGHLGELTMLLAEVGQYNHYEQQAALQRAPHAVFSTDKLRSPQVRIAPWIVCWSATLCLVTVSVAVAQEQSPAAAAEKVHAEIWRRYIDEHGLLLDFTDLDGKVSLPTSADCRDNKPNALAWWTPIENGAMFNGMYIDACIQRFKRSGLAADREQVRRLAAGLLFLSQVGITPGFIARGVADDGKSHYPMGSDDQSLPWFYGLWRYARSGIPTPAERTAVIAQLVAVAEVLEQTNWRMPCDAAPFQYRGSFAAVDWQHAPRLLFLCRALHDLTGDAKWEQHYQHFLRHQTSPTAPTRLQICAKGMVFHGKSRHSWTGVNSVLPLRALWELETDEAVRAEYLAGLRASAALGAEGIELYRKYDNHNQTLFDTDWRRLNELWKPQTTEAESVAVAEAQSSLLNRLAPRRPLELMYVREPLFAAWVVTLCPDPAVVEAERAKIEAAIAHYHYDRLYFSQFFAAECAWQQLQTSSETKR